MNLSKWAKKRAGQYFALGYSWQEAFDKALADEKVRCSVPKEIRNLFEGDVE